MIQQNENHNMNFFQKLSKYGKLSGPGWIQAAVTLGGGTLVGALYLGVIGGYEFLWLQPLAMLCGVIMLWAISYVTLSKEKEEDRPFELVKKHVSPLLAWGWLFATVIANVVFCSAQFALGADAIQGNLGGNSLNPYFITSIIFIVAGILIWMFSGEGRLSKIIDQFIKGLVAIIVLAFMGVVIVLMKNGAIEWGALGNGLIPDFSALFPSHRFLSNPSFSDWGLSIFLDKLYCRKSKKYHHWRIWNGCWNQHDFFTSLFYNEEKMGKRRSGIGKI